MRPFWHGEGLSDFRNERQLQKLFAMGLSIESAIDYTPKPGDSDYLPKSDVPWIKRFASAGGKVVISGNTAMRKVSPERLALVEEGMIVIFFEDSWNNKLFFTKCALLMHWWPVIARAKPCSFYHVPSNWKENGKLRKVSNADQKKLKIIKQIKAGPAKRRERQAKRAKRLQNDQGDLFPDSLDVQVGKDG